MADWGPLDIATEHVRGSANTMIGRTDFHIEDGILLVTHFPSGDEDMQELAFRLVEVKKTWVEVDGG